MTTPNFFNQEPGEETAWVSIKPAEDWNTLRLKVGKDAEELAVINLVDILTRTIDGKTFVKIVTPENIKVSIPNNSDITYNPGSASVAGSGMYVTTYTRMTVADIINNVGFLVSSIEIKIDGFDKIGSAVSDRLEWMVAPMRMYGTDSTVGLSGIIGTWTTTTGTITGGTYTT